MSDERENYANVLVASQPKFSGMPEDWPFFKPKFKAHLAKRKLSELLTYQGTIPKDDHTFSSDATTKAKEERIQKFNVEAAGLLLNSMDTSTLEGKAAFYQVEKYMDDGYTGGHFPKAWEALCQRFDEKEIVNVVDLQQEYFDMKMQEGEKPSLFIVELERMRKRLKDNGLDISDEDFQKHVLAKLPKGSEGMIGPYQSEKRAVELRIAIQKTAYTLAKMTNDLDKVYADINAVESKNDIVMAAYGQFKKKCLICGMYGHKAANCKKRGGSFSFRGQCFWCNQPGHKIWDCDEFKQLKADRDAEKEIGAMASEVVL